MSLIIDLPKLETYITGYDSLTKIYSISLSNVPFINGQFEINSVHYYSLECSRIQSDSISQSLKIIIASTIPNCITPPACTSGQETITLIRTTKNYASQEDFIIRDSNGYVRFRQPDISNNKIYTWSITLCKGEYTIVMTDSKDKWNIYSNVVIKKGSTTIDTFRCSNYHSTISSFTV